MTTLTSGTFLVAMAVQLGASNFQIGLLAAMPTLTNVFQLIAIWLVQRYNNRRIVTVIANLFARFPLFIVGLLPFLFSTGTSIQVLIFFLFFHYFFGSIAGASWNSWMKDLVPEERLGAYFSNRNRLTQMLNVVMSLLLALVLDYVKQHYPGSELTMYSMMFIAGGLFGLAGTYILSRTPEPRSHLAKENLVKLFSRPLRDGNFRKLLFFNSFWSFALNLATPFFTVYMMNVIGLPISYIIAFGIMSQFAGIMAVKVWGRLSDQYSNKTIIRIAAPVYICCILAWSVVSVPSSFFVQLSLIGVINVLTGMATSGINLSLTNIGIKLAPRDSAIAYISVKNMIVAFVSALAPLLGGGLADLFSTNTVVSGFIKSHSWNFLFVFAGLLAIVALRTLRRVEEQGEIAKGFAMNEMKVVFGKKMEEGMTRESILALLLSPVTYPTKLGRRMIKHIDNKVTIVRKFGRKHYRKTA